MESLNDLKKKSLHGVFWSFIQKFGILFLSFLTNIFLVRFLTPEDFGVFGVLLIFISFADIFIDSGFGSALIQKQKVTSLDYSSIFYFNIFVSLIIFLLFYLSSGYVAEYFKNEQLSVLLKVQSFVVIFNGLCVVQNNILQKNLKFKKLAGLTTTVAIIANIITIVLAYYNIGTWSLVFRSLITSFSTFVLLWFFSDWKPKKEFSFDSLKNLSSFGAYMFISGFVEKIYTSLQSFIIGKYFSISQLGFYSQASRLQELPANTISQVLNQVTFPLYSSINGNKSNLKSIFKRNFEILSFIVIPFFLILFFNSRELILLLYGEKWLDSIFYFKFLCLYGITIPINIMHTNIIKSLGNGKLYFLQQFFKRAIGIILILFSVFYGLEAIMISTILSGYIFLAINSYITSKNLGYKMINQGKDFFSSVLPNFLPIFFCVFLSLNSFSGIIKILLTTLVYILLFLVSCFLLKNKSIFFIINILKKINK